MNKKIFNLVFYFLLISLLTGAYFVQKKYLSASLSKPIPNRSNLRSGKALHFSKGDHYFSENLVVRTEDSITVEAGARLIFAQGTSLIINGSANFDGNRENPIVLTSEAGRGWNGIVIVKDDDIKDFLYDPPGKFKNYSEAALFLKTFALNIRKILVYIPSISFNNVKIRSVKSHKDSKNNNGILIKNAYVKLSNVEVSELKDVDAVKADGAILIVENSILSSCRSENVINLIKSFVILNQSSILLSCNEMKSFSMGELKTEAISALESELLIRNTKIYNMQDDFIEASQSRVVLINNVFDGTEDNCIDINENTVGIGYKNTMINSGEANYSITNSQLISIEDVFDSSSPNCYKLRNSSYLLELSSKCSTRYTYEAVFDLRKCIKRNGPCSQDKKLLSDLGRFLSYANPDWAKLNTLEMMNYGGPYADAIKNYPSNKYKSEYDNFYVNVVKKYASEKSHITTNTLGRSISPENNTNLSAEISLIEDSEKKFKLEIMNELKYLEGMF